MLREFLVPLVTLVVSMTVCVCCIHHLCQFHQIYLGMSARLESERWLVAQCEDPHFFAKMHLHTDLCFTVSNNARVGALMLSLQDFTKVLLSSASMGGHWGFLGGWIARLLFSWVGAAGFGVLLMFGPAWVFSGARGLGRRWPDCKEGHFKDA